MSEEVNCQDWQSAVYVVGLDVEKAAVLLCRNDEGEYGLPTFGVEGRVWETTTAKMQEQIGPALKLEGQVLYRRLYEEDEDSCRGKAVLIMDIDEGDDLRGEWFGLRELSGLSLVESEYRPLIEEVLQELETGLVPEKRPPWARPGWYEVAEDWLRAEVSRAGWTVAGPVEPGRSWALSYVMRVPAYKDSPTERVFFYFKTSIDLPLFVNEAVVTNELAALFPGHVPQPVALDRQRDWMVLADFGPLVGHDAPLEDKLEILRQFAGIQKESAVMVEQLVAAGCCDRRLAWMVEEIEPFLTDPEIEMAITAEEVAQLRSLVAPLQTLCRELYEYDVPDTLMHGDLHGSNVARNDSQPGGLLFFDWTDCAVSHPFFDMLLIYTTKEAADREKMRDLYLSQWLDYEPLDRLLELWQMARVLAAVYHGISYFYIRNGLEEWGRSEMYWAMPYWLRKILEYSESIYEK